MEQNDWQRVKEIFNAALVKPATERDGFLQEACGDDGSIRDEVRSLISSFDDADSFLESPVLEDSTNSSATWQFQFKDGQELDKYTIIRRIGAGGMGEVYLARDTKLKRDVALKLLSSRFIPDKEHLKRFEVEAFAASSLNHPNIITVYDVGDSGGTHFIAEEYVEGRTLDKCCQGDEDPGLLVKLNMAVQIASALAATHEAGIIHRDIKPENIMVRPDGLVKVLDFGIAKLSERDNSGEE
jgi:serine/threonine protein kinase